MTAVRPILFATDGSPSADEAQKEAFELAHRLGAPLVVVSVAHAALPAVGYAGYGYSNIVAELTQAEHKRVKELLADGFAVEEICEVAREHDVQLIVVGSHGWGAARRFFSGSVSTGLVHSAPCPVLVVRPEAHPAEHAAAA